MSQTNVKAKWRSSPHAPGVYVMKDALGGVIYVGKARDLKRRLSNYFAPSRQQTSEPKTRALIAAIADFDYHTVRTEQEALLLEAKLIKEWRPHYNIQFRDDKRYFLVRARSGETCPHFELTRLRRENGGRYWGPFPHSTALKATLDWLNREFHLRSCTAREPSEIHYKHCHDDIIRNCSAPCIGRISPEEYNARFEEAVSLLEGRGRRDLLKRLQEEMQEAAARLEFERAGELRDVWQNLEKTLEPARRFSSGKGLPSTVRPLDDLKELADALGLPEPPELMECFDISNVSSNHIVASMVRFRNGRPDGKAYRRYRIKSVEGQNDFASMAEVIRRRYSRLSRENATLPDLVVVDGGKGQLSMAMDELEKLGVRSMTVVGLAKKREEIFFPDNPDPIVLPHDTGALKLLQRLRDEAHRFANGYNELLLRRRMKESELDDIPGMTAGRKEALLKRFKSVSRLKKATVEEIAGIRGISKLVAGKLHRWLHKDASS